MIIPSIIYALCIVWSAGHAAVIIDSDATFKQAEYDYTHEPHDDDRALALVDVYLFGPKVHQDSDKALAILTKLVARQNCEGIELMAGMYLNGRGVASDEGTAFRFYHQGADLGHAPCQFNLGILYMQKAFRALASSDRVQSLFDISESRARLTHRPPPPHTLSLLSADDQQCYHCVRAYAAYAYTYLQHAFLARKDLESIADAAADHRNRLCAFLTQDEIYQINQKIFTHARTQ